MNLRLVAAGRPSAILTLYASAVFRDEGLCFFKEQESQRVPAVQALCHVVHDVLGFFVRIRLVVARFPLYHTMEREFRLHSFNPSPVIPPFS